MIAQDRRLVSILGHAPLRRLALWAAFLCVMLVAILLDRTQEEQQAVAKSLSAAVRQGVEQGGLVPLVKAGAAFGLWLLWLIARPLLIFGAFFLVELAFLGPPRKWTIAFFALAVQIALTLLYFVFGPVLGAVLPREMGNGSLILIDQAQFPSLLAPVAPVLLAVVALLVYGLSAYWLHRAQHRFSFLWRFHSVHHSIEDLDSLNSYAHPIDGIGDRITFILASILIGFNFDTTVWILALTYIHDRLLHTRAPINFGFLGHILIDNRHHFAHHTARAADSGTNFSTWFTIYDRAFGTYARPHPTVLPSTGLEHSLPPRTLLQFFAGTLPPRPPDPAADQQLSHRAKEARQLGLGQRAVAGADIFNDVLCPRRAEEIAENVGMAGHELDGRFGGGLANTLQAPGEARAFPQK